MNARLVKNIFDQSELDLIHESVYSQYSSRTKESADIYEVIKTGWENKIKVEQNVGKASFEARPMPKEILDKVISYAKESGYDVSYNDLVCIFMRYSNEFGKPALHPHLDLHNWGLSIDYQLKATIDWPVIIEDVEYQLHDNDALIFDSSIAVHWRPVKKLDNTDFVDMILFHFFVDGKEKLSQEEKANRVSPYLSKYLKEEN